VTTKQLEPLLRRPELKKFVGLKNTQLDLLIKAGDFPAPIKLSDGGRAVAWLESEVRAWQASRIAARNHKAA
jgi:prophage regulatory protein